MTTEILSTHHSVTVGRNSITFRSGDRSITLNPAEVRRSLRLHEQMAGGHCRFVTDAKGECRCRQDVPVSCPNWVSHRETH